MLAGFCPVEGYSEDVAKFIVISALGTVFPCLNWIKHFRKKKKFETFYLPRVGPVKRNTLYITYNNIWWWWCYWWWWLVTKICYAQQHMTMMILMMITGKQKYDTRNIMIILMAGDQNCLTRITYTVLSLLKTTLKHFRKNNNWKQLQVEAALLFVTHSCHRNRLVIPRVILRWGIRDK